MKIIFEGLDNVGKSTQIEELRKQIANNSLVSAVQSLYVSFLASKDKYITHEYTIREVLRLSEKLDEDIDANTKGNIDFLIAVIKRGVHDELIQKGNK